MYNLLKSIDFSLKRSQEKTRLKELFFEWVLQQNPHIKVDSSPWFSDALFIANNPYLGLDLIDTIENEDYDTYFSILVRHFTNKRDNPFDNFGQDPEMQAEIYVDALKRLKQFLDQNVLCEPSNENKKVTAKMKLAEALIIRADIQNKIQQLQIRLSNNATVQAGEKPNEEPQHLLQEFNQAVAELEKLIAKINLSNAQIKKDGQTMTELLATRDCLKMKLGTYRNFLNEASSLTRRSRASEIVVKSAMPIGDLQKQVDHIAADLRKIDLTIQELNWTNELLD